MLEGPWIGGIAGAAEACSSLGAVEALVSLVTPAFGRAETLGRSISLRRGGAARP